MFCTVTILTVLLSICVEKCHKSSKSLAVYTFPVLISIYFPIAAFYLDYFGIKFDIPNLVAFSFYLDAIGTNFLIYFSVRLLTNMTNNKFANSIVDKFYFFIVFFNSIIVALNPLFGHVFHIDTNLENDYTGSFTLVYDWYNSINLSIMYVGVFMIFAALFHKLVISPIINNQKYIYITLSYATVVSVQTCFLLMDTVKDYSILAYIVCGLLLYYFCIEYIPTPIIEKMKTVILDSMNDGIIFFNDKGERIYSNFSAEFLLPFDIHDNKVLKPNIISLLEEDEQSLSLIQDKEVLTVIEDIERNIERKVLELEYHKIYSEGYHIGSFVKIDNRTEEYKRMEEEYYKSMYDSLTGLMNANSFYDKVSETLRSADNEDDYIAIATDIKEFKLINDRYGRASGDSILKSVAEHFLKACLNTVAIGRLGVDKYAILVQKDHFSEEKLNQIIKSIPPYGGDVNYPIILHCGVYLITDKSMTPAMVFDRAALAIKSVKNNFNKRIAWYDESVRDRMLWELRVTNDFEKAINNDEFVPYLQAQVNSDGVVEGAEALVRWNHPTAGFLTPNRFIDILEKNGNIAKLDLHIWDCACRLLSRWKKMGKGEYYISVNISPNDFYLMDIPFELEKLILKYDIDPANLRLEITETVMMKDLNLKISTIEQLRDLGFMVEMDDFGSGYSSLNMLKNLPVDILKLDMVFVNDKTNIEKTKRIMKLIIDMAKDLFIPVIAEGVELEEQVSFLRDMGCDYFQGYYFSKPICAEEYEDNFFS